MDIKQLVNKQLENMSSTIEDICKEWETKTVPLNMIEKVIELSVINDKELETKAQKIFIANYNKMLSTLIKTCTDKCAVMESTKLPLDIFIEYINVIKTNFNKSAKQ